MELIQLAKTAGECIFVASVSVENDQGNALCRRCHQMFSILMHIEILIIDSLFQTPLMVRSIHIFFLSVNRQSGNLCFKDCTEIGRNLASEALSLRILLLEDTVHVVHKNSLT